MQMEKRIQALEAEAVQMKELKHHTITHGIALEEALLRNVRPNPYFKLIY